jgi:hypothetical protein
MNRYARFLPHERVARAAKEANIRDVDVVRSIARELHTTRYSRRMLHSRS